MDVCNSNGASKNGTMSLSISTPIIVIRLAWVNSRNSKSNLSSLLLAIEGGPPRKLRRWAFVAEIVLLLLCPLSTFPCTLFFLCQMLGYDFNNKRSELSGKKAKDIALDEHIDILFFCICMGVHVTLLVRSEEKLVFYKEFRYPHTLSECHVITVDTCSTHYMFFASSFRPTHPS